MVDYIRMCVEEKTGRIGNLVYNKAIDLAKVARCKSMDEQINAIAANVRLARSIVLGGER